MDATDSLGRPLRDRCHCLVLHAAGDLRLGTCASESGRSPSPAPARSSSTWRWAASAIRTCTTCATAASAAARGALRLREPMVLGHEPHS